MHFIYDNTGRFVKKISCAAEMAEENVMANLPDGGGAVLDWIGNINPDTHYYNGGVVTARPSLQTTINKAEIQANGSDTFILSGLPVFNADSPFICVAIVSDKNTEIDDISTEIIDGEFGFYTTISGEYVVIVEAFPFITEIWEITAI